MLDLVSPDNTSVLIVDDDERITTAFSRVLRSASCDVVTSHTLAESLQLLLAHPVHVVLLDWRMSDGLGDELLSHIHGLRPSPAVAIISGHVTAELVIDLHSRVDAVVPKPIAGPELIRLVEAIRPRGKLAARTAGGFCRQYCLSRRETQVLQGATRGLQNKGIADELGCKVATVVTYWRRIYAKTGTHSRNEVLSLVLGCSAPVCRGCLNCTTWHP